MNFNNKTFSLLENSENGKVNSDTIFAFKQEGDLVTADYYGGSIQYGKIIAKLRAKDQQMDMLYQCLTVDGELKAGKALGHISLNDEGKIQLKLDWEWLGDKKDQGTSEYIEN